MSSPAVRLLCYNLHCFRLCHLIINLPFNPRMNSTTTVCSFTKGHFPLRPTESWLLPRFDDFRYTEDNSGGLPAGGMSLLVLSGYEQPLTGFPLMGDGRVLKKQCVGRQPWWWPPPLPLINYCKCSKAAEHTVSFYTGVIVGIPVNGSPDVWLVFFPTRAFVDVCLALSRK